MSEKKIQNDSFLAVGMLDDVMIMRIHSGVFRSLTDNRIIKVGVKGYPDSLLITGVEITPDMVGQKVAIVSAAEFKTEKGRQSAEQVNFQKAFEKLGGLYRLIKKVDDIIELVRLAKRKV